MATTSLNMERLGLQADADTAQHTPLYPSLGRVGYVPDRELHEARLEASTKRLLASGEVNALAKGWPSVLTGPMVWSGYDMEKTNHWVYTFSSNDITEVRSALAHCKGNRLKLDQFPRFLQLTYVTLGLKLDLSQVNRTSFPLPRFGNKLRCLSEEVHAGRGFFVLRGLDPADFTREENVILYLGISSYVAEERGRQSHDGSLLCK